MNVNKECKFNNNNYDEDKLFIQSCLAITDKLKLIKLQYYSIRKVLKVSPSPISYFCIAEINTQKIFLPMQ